MVEQSDLELQWDYHRHMRAVKDQRGGFWPKTLACYAAVKPLNPFSHGGYNVEADKPLTLKMHLSGTQIPQPLKVSTDAT